MTLKLGIPKGSLQESTYALFKKAGFTFRSSLRSYQPTVDDEELEPILLRPQEIPAYIEQGIIDAGLTGADWIADTGANLHEICELQYSKATNRPIQIVLAVHDDSPYRAASDLAGKRIATEYVRLANRYFKESNVDAEVEFSWGACEVKVPELVDAIVVNTETGSSLRAHNLRIIDTLLVSTTRFVCSHEVWRDDWKRAKLESLEILLTGAMNAAKLVGLKMNVPASGRETILSLLPSLKNPTISPLSDPDWIAVEVILEEVQVRDLIPKLKRAGATGLVEYPLNKVVY